MDTELKDTTYASAQYSNADEKRRKESLRAEKEQRADADTVAAVDTGNWRKNLFIILDEPESGVIAKIVSLIILILIIISSVSIVIETMRFVRVNEDWKEALKLTEWICIILFTVEYLLRAFTCSERPGEDQSVIKFLLKTMTLVDLFAILPFYIELAFGGVVNLAFLRALRMTRVFRVLKVGAYDETLQLFVKGFGRCKDGLTLLLFLLLMYLCCFAAFLHMFEYTAQLECTDGCPSVRGFTSIPTTWYFIIATMTTVGYGDMYPITFAGQITASMCMLCGIFVLGLPIVIIGNSFDEVFKEDAKWKKDKEKRDAMREEVLAKQKLKDESTENPLKGDSDDDEKTDENEQILSFNTSAALHSVADVLEALYQKTDEPRFDEAWHVLMDDLGTTGVVQAYDTNGDGNVDSWDTTGDGKIDLQTD